MPRVPTNSNSSATSRSLAVQNRHVQKEFLNEQTARPEQHTSPLVDEFLTDDAEQMRLATARIAEGQDVLLSVQEAALQDGRTA